MRILKRKYIAAIVLPLFLISCKNLFSQSALPETWPPDMVLKISYGGGMRYYSTETVISLSESYTLVNNEGREIRTALHFTQEQLNALLRLFRKHQFDQLHTAPRPGIVYDMGTSTTQLTWKGGSAGVSIGASTYLPEKYSAQFSAVQAAISRMLGYSPENDG